MYHLRLLGGASLEGPSGPVTGRAAQRRPLALLALLAATPGLTLSRDKLVAYLWPETGSKRARHHLSVSLHALRKALGAEAILSVNDDLRLDPELVSADVVAFGEALEAGDPERAAELYAGPFLDGFHVSGAPAFERWVDGRQAEYARGYRKALEALAEAAEERGAWEEAVARWKERAAEEPWSSRVAVRLMRALEAAGDRPAALRHARVHARLVREELGTEPDPEVLALADRIGNGELERETGRQPSAPGTRPERRAGASGRESEAALHPKSEADATGADAAREAPDPAPATAISPGTASPDRAPGNERRRSDETAGGRLARALRSTPAAAAAAAGVLLAVGVVAIRASGEAEPAYDSKSVLVDLFANRTEDPALEEVGRMATDWITQGLSYTGFVDVVTLGTPLLARSPALDPSELEAHGARLAREHGVGTLVWGNVYRRGDSLYFQAHLTDTRDRRVLASLDPVAAPVDGPVTGLERLRDRVMTALATRTDPRLEKWQRNASKPPGVEAYRKFVEGLELRTNLYRYREMEDRNRRAAEFFRQAAALDPDFTMAKLWLALTPGVDEEPILRELNETRERLAPLDRAFLDYQLVLPENDEMERLRAARRMVEIAPGSGYLKLAGNAALAANRPAEAVRHYERADPESGWLRGYTPYWRHLAEAHHLLGNHQRELKVARRGRALYPDDGAIRQREMRALAALGRIEELEATLPSLRGADGDREGWALAAAAEELIVHGHEEEGRQFLRRSARWYRARVVEAESTAEERRQRVFLLVRLRTLGDLAAADEQLEVLLAEHPEDGRVLREGAMLRAKQGRREAAMEFLQRFEKVGPWNLSPHPEVAALLGDRERAISILRRFDASAGLHRSWYTHAPAFWPLHGYPPFEELMEPEG